MENEMSLIELNDGCLVAADQIEEISIRPHGGIVVRMKSGIAHHLGHDYGRSDYDTLERLTKEINAALKPESKT